MENGGCVKASSNGSKLKNLHLSKSRKHSNGVSSSYIIFSSNAEASNNALRWFVTNEKK